MRTEFKNLCMRIEQGDSEAFYCIMDFFKERLCKYSYINGRFNDDCFQELSIKLFQCAKRFRLNSAYNVLELKKELDTHTADVEPRKDEN